ncbi:hypothetical protein H4219_004062 [Mycoemilia scoparia]|uniref:FAD dependent oxidoreductase domain-containing protein n=1 Tax=Mycoemilia scoparia TaxID=417184 RepID=A0A9W7ZTR7_9FUNG|nr:hypothetical protein H4219_004062 [Mycoemilia scoparia]
MPDKKFPVVVIGAGVIGLTTALSLQRTGKFQVTIISSQYPRSKGAQESQDWASPWAGAHWRSWAGDDPDIQRMEEQTFHELVEIIKTTPEAGVSFIAGIEYMEDRHKPYIWYRSLVKGFKEIPKEYIPADMNYGCVYETLVINVPKYLGWLFAQFLDQGGKLVEQHLPHINDATKYLNNILPPNSPRIVVNCTALGAMNLGGVLDKNMYPIRGHTVLVDLPLSSKGNLATVTKQGPRNETTYVIPRGDGTVILGGTRQPYNQDRIADPEKTDDILINVLNTYPQIIDGLYVGEDDTAFDVLKRRIISENVGFRPARHGGVRFDVEIKGKFYY